MKNRRMNPTNSPPNPAGADRPLLTYELEETMPTTQAATSPDLEQERLEDIVVELLRILTAQDRLVIHWTRRESDGDVRAVTRSAHGGVVINVNF